MRRTITFGLAVLLLALFTRQAVTEVHAKPSWRFKECRFQSLQRPLWTPLEERLTTECAVGKWTDYSISTVSAIAQCESGWNRFASNGGRYLGLFQHAASSYVGRIHQYEPAAWDRDLSTRWTNSRGQIVMSVRMMNAVGLSPWSCA